MLTHSFTRGWSSGGASLQKVVVVQAGAELNIDELIAGLSSDAVVEFAMDVSQLYSLFIVSDAALTLKTNSLSAPSNTFAIAANVPFTWMLGDPSLRDTSNAAVTDITSLHVVNAGSGDAQLQIRALYDPTV